MLVMENLKSKDEFRDRIQRLGECLVRAVEAGELTIIESYDISGRIGLAWAREEPIPIELQGYLVDM